MGEPRRALDVKRTDRVVLSLPATPERISNARTALEQLELPPGMLADAKLLISEIVTNSMRHAGLGAGDLIRVTAEWTGTTLRVLVQDGTVPTSPPVAGGIRPAPGAESGWGLYLVDQLASRWGTNLKGQPGYWFELRSDPD
jgi:anti-sigma regulatory factor (Ser/Thr protein kinase)